MTVAFAALFGLAFGSFANAAIDRIPRGASLNGRSACDGCGVTLTARQLIPVVSYFIQGGRCAACDSPIGLRTPVVEISCAVAFVTAFIALPPGAALLACAAFVAVVVTTGVVVMKRSSSPMTDGAVPALRDLLMTMVESNASDLHLSHGTPPVYRRQGELAAAPGIAALSSRELWEALEMMTNEVERERFERDRELDKALDLPGVGRFRVNVGFERGHLYFSFRLVNDRVLSIEDLGLPAVCDRLTQLPRGLVLVTGPTGSGKSTTLASMIDRINKRDARHVITIEDPIEFVHHNQRSVIEQREVGIDTTSFAEALKRVCGRTPT